MLLLELHLSLFISTSQLLSTAFIPLTTVLKSDQATFVIQILTREDLSKTRASEARLVVYVGFTLNWKLLFFNSPTEFKNIQG